MAARTTSQRRTLLLFLSRHAHAAHWKTEYLSKVAFLGEREKPALGLAACGGSSSVSDSQCQTKILYPVTDFINNQVFI